MRRGGASIAWLWVHKDAIGYGATRRSVVWFALCQESTPNCQESQMPSGTKAEAESATKRTPRPRQRSVRPRYDCDSANRQRNHNKNPRGQPTPPKKPPPPRAVRPGATESSRRRPCHPENTPHALASRPLSYIPLANQTDLSKHQWLRGAESRCVCDRSVCLRRVRIRVAECEQLVCLLKARRRAPATIESDARLVSKAAVQTWGCFVLASAAANGLPTGCPREVPLGCRPT